MTAKKKVRVFRLPNNPNELPAPKIKHQTNPDKWTWKPAYPEKIKQFKKWESCKKKIKYIAFQTNYKPGKKKQRIALIFSMGTLSESVLRSFNEKGIKYFYMAYSDFILGGEVNISFSEGANNKILKYHGLELDLNDVASVIWVGPSRSTGWDFFSTSPKDDNESLDEYLYRKRWVALFKDLKGLMPLDTVWIPSHPFNGCQEWQNRNAEYSIAQQLGFNVPPTICTTSYKDLVSFAKEHGGQLMFREFSCSPYNFRPYMMTISEIKKIPYLEQAPCTFQKYIEKEYELRIVYFGGKVYVCKVHSQDSKIPEARFDWRCYDNPSVKWELSFIPKDFERKIKKLMKELDLEWGSLDFVKAKDGKYYFLEVNRPGCHYWLELFVGLDMGRIMADHLVDVIKIETC